MKDKIETKKKESKVDEKTQKINELTNSLQRLQAEFENFKKRCDKDSERYRTFANIKLIEKLLPIVDTFDLAIKNSEDAIKFKQGIELIYVQIQSLLKNEGVEKIIADHMKMDPNLHEVMMAVESDKESNTIIEVLQEGYMIKGNVVRHSKVKIAK